MAVVCSVGSVNKGGGQLLARFCGSGSCTWFLGRRRGLLAPCALEMHSEAPIVVLDGCLCIVL